MPMGHRRAAFVLLLGGIALLTLGAWAVTEAALGHNGGTDTSPGFGYAIGCPELLVGVILLLGAARLARR